MIFCTITCANHLPLAMVMAQSVKETHNDAKMILCLVEEEVHLSAKDFAYFDQVVLAKDLGIPDFSRFVFKYNKYEATCAVKPYLLLYLFGCYDEENKFVYVDADIKVYSCFDEVIQVLNKASIVLTPHLIEPNDINHYEEIARLRDGVYNGGFVGISRSRESEEFLKWWATRTYYHSYIDYKTGLFLDQKWLDLIPCYFANYYILNHPGYNIANWNFTKRKIVEIPNHEYLVNGECLRFIHFSGLGNIYLPDKQEPFCIFRDQFLDEIKQRGYDLLIEEPWSYDYFFSGEYIEPKTKSRYRKSQKVQDNIPDPFSQSNRDIKRMYKQIKGE